MLKFRLDEIVLVSHKEGRGRQITFHPLATIIKGPNDTGKSSMIKSIWEAFGAVAPNVHPRWRYANVSSLVTFQINDERFAIFRSGSSYSLFNSQNSLIGTYHSVTNDLGPQLASIFNFQLRLVDQKKEVKIPPPAFLLLPFYLDQDQSWLKNWWSFKNLGQFKNWRRDTILYHTGIRPNRWYELNGKAQALEASIDEPLQRERVLKTVIRKLEADISTASFDIDITSYKKEINRLLRRCEELKTAEEDYKSKLVELESERMRLEATREVIRHARKELHADYTFAAALEGDLVGCPICGASYANELEERFAIAHDEDRCVNLLQDLQRDLQDIDVKIVSQKETLSEYSKELKRVNSALTEKQGRLTLKSIIQKEGKRQVSSVLFGDLDNLGQEIGRIESELRDIKEQLHRLEDKERRGSILAHYQAHMQHYCNVLNVTQLSRKAFRSVDCNIIESGSDLPRALLAYFFTILQTIQSFGAFESFPIVIDAPNQQEQDHVNIRRMLEVIRDNRPEGSQLILGLVDDYGIDFGGAVINMNQPNYALSQEKYEEAAKRIRPFAEANLRS